MSSSRIKTDVLLVLVLVVMSFCAGAGVMRFALDPLIPYDGEIERLEAEVRVYKVNQARLLKALDRARYRKRISTVIPVASM